MIRRINTFDVIRDRKDKPVRDSDGKTQMDEDTLVTIEPSPNALQEALDMKRKNRDLFVFLEIETEAVEKIRTALNVKGYDLHACKGKTAGKYMLKPVAKPAPAPFVVDLNLQ